MSDQEKREMDQMHRDIRELRSDIKQLMRAVEALKVKASVWGGIGGAFTVLIGLTVSILKGVMK